MKSRRVNSSNVCCQPDYLSGLCTGAIYDLQMLLGTRQHLRSCNACAIVQNPRWKRLKTQE